MMKKLQVMVEDNHFKALKQKALDEDTTVTALINEMIQGYFDTPHAEKPKNTQKELPISTKSDKMEVEYDPNIHFLVRKTHKKRKETDNRVLQKYGVLWTTMEGNFSHYDKDGNIIPFRMTTDTGKEYDLSEDEIKELEEATGKKVIFE